MSVAALRPLLAGLAPIGLEELIGRASLLTRIDRKYLLPIDEVAAVLAQVGADTQILEIDDARSFDYESVYFDTPDFVSYLLAAHRRRNRFKVRTRVYLDSSLCWLEVKTRGSRGSTVKNRIQYRPRDCHTLGPGRGFVDSILTREFATESDQLRLEPTLATRYRRSTLFLPATTSRATIDTELMWTRDGHPCLRLPGLAVVETKTGSTASHLDKLLWNRGHRPVRISKYATGLAALRPDLPATPWRRTLRRHFAPAAFDHRRFSYSSTFD